MGKPGRFLPVLGFLGFQMGFRCRRATLMDWVPMKIGLGHPGKTPARGEDKGSLQLGYRQ